MLFIKQEEWFQEFDVTFIKKEKKEWFQDVLPTYINNTSNVA